MLANVIGANEGVFVGDDAERKREILTYSAFYKEFGKRQRRDFIDLDGDMYDYTED